MVESANGMQRDDAAGVFAVKIAVLLDEDRADDALATLHDDANEGLVLDACLELFSVIGERMNKDDLVAERPDVWEYMQSMLEYLTKMCKPKEVLIALLELLEHVSGDAMFHLVLLMLKIAFLRLPNRRGAEFVWALHAIVEYLRKLPQPPSHQLDDDELVVLENCTVSRRLEQCVMTALVFCDPFVSEARRCCRADEKARRSRSLQLACFLLKLLERPIADFEVGDSTKIGYTAPFSQCANRTMDLLIDLFPDVLQLHQIINSGSAFSLLVRFSLAIDYSGDLKIDCRLSEGSTMTATVMSVGVLEFFMQLGGRGRCRQPNVYSDEFVFDTCLPACVALCQESCERNSAAVARKGVALFESLLQRVHPGIWSRDRLTIPTYQVSAENFLVC